MRPCNISAENDRIFALQMLHMRKHFPRFKCSLKNRCLQCTGNIIPDEGCNEYTIRIVYHRRGVPKVYIEHPTITPSPAIHTYADGRLCLYDPRVTPWSGKYHLHETIMPWTAEWLVYFELYKIHGEWFGPEAPHSGTDEKKEDKATL